MNSSKRNAFTSKLTSFIGVGTFAVLVSVPSLAQTTRPATPNQMNRPATTAPAGANTTAPTSPASASALDSEFITMAAQGNNAEIQMSQLALQRSTDENVRQYAQMMIDQHTAANQKLEPLAAERGVNLPTTASSFDTAVLQQLSQTPDADFNKAYMNAQVNAHLKSAGVFRTGAQQVQDAALRNYAASLVPAIQDHLAMANRLTGSQSAQRIQ